MLKYNRDVARVGKAPSENNASKSCAESRSNVKQSSDVGNRQSRKRQNSVEMVPQEAASLDTRGNQVIKTLRFRKGFQNAKLCQGLICCFYHIISAFCCQGKNRPPEGVSHPLLTHFLQFLHRWNGLISTRFRAFLSCWLQLRFSW